MKSNININIQLKFVFAQKRMSPPVPQTVVKDKKSI